MRYAEYHNTWTKKRFNFLFQIVQLGSLDHDNIIKFYGTSLQDRNLWFITGFPTSSVSHIKCLYIAMVALLSRVRYKFISSWLHTCESSWAWGWAKPYLGTTNSWRCVLKEILSWKFPVDVCYRFCRNVLSPSAETLRCSQGPKTQQWYQHTN